VDSSQRWNLETRKRGGKEKALGSWRNVKGAEIDDERGKDGIAKLEKNRKVQPQLQTKKPGGGKSPFNTGSWHKT